jgi:hypothetical protein
VRVEPTIAHLPHALSRLVVPHPFNALHSFQVAAALREAEPLRSELQKRGVLVVPLPIFDDTEAEAAAVAEVAVAGAAAGRDTLPALTPEDQRWRAEPLRLADWKSWFEQQLSFSTKAKPENGCALRGRRCTRGFVKEAIVSCPGCGCPHGCPLTCTSMFPGGQVHVPRVPDSHVDYHSRHYRRLFVGLRLDGRVRSSGSGSPPWRRYALELAPLEGDKAWTGFFDGFDGRV